MVRLDTYGVRHCREQKKTNQSQGVAVEGILRQRGPSRRLSAPRITAPCRSSGNRFSVITVACRQIKYLTSVTLHAEQKFTDQLVFYTKFRGTDKDVKKLQSQLS